MMAVLLWCAHCGEEAVFSGDVPVVCPTCKQVTTWSTAKPYHVTEMDARFLRSIHVAHGKQD